MSGWHNVSRREPCPICQKPDWCTVSNDGMMCVCKRVPSPHPSKSGKDGCTRSSNAPNAYLYPACRKGRGCSFLTRK